MVMGELAEGTQVAVIGGGPAGYVCALRLAQLAKQVTVIEKEGLGGLCLLHGCIPSKALIRASSMVSEIADAKEIGINAQITSIDWAKTQEWKNKVVAQLNNGTKGLCKAAGVQVIYGTAFFESPRQLAVVKAEGGVIALDFENVVIATGSLPYTTADLPFDSQSIVSSKEALDFTSIPKSLAVVGGGYVGIELAEVYAKAGSQVTIIARSTLLSSQDPDASAVLQKRLTELGVKIILHSTTNGFSKLPDGRVSLNVNTEGAGASTVECEKVLVAVGHKPNTAGLKIEKSGVLVDEKGFITVNEKRQSSVPHIYAIGDVAGGPMLAHKAYREAKVAAEAICGKQVSFDNQVVPAVVFCEPEIAYVGLQEHEAKKAGRQVLVGKFPHIALGKGIIEGRPTGFVKLIADSSSHALLGALVVGPESSTIIHEAALAIESGLLLEDVAHTIHAHPTMSEAMAEAAELALGIDVHLPQRK
jgi:dihydrolipoamide dehydrogenase